MQPPLLAPSAAVGTSPQQDDGEGNAIKDSQETVRRRSVFSKRQSVIDCIGESHGLHLITDGDSDDDELHSMISTATNKLDMPGIISRGIFRRGIIEARRLDLSRGGKGYTYDEFIEAHGPDEGNELWKKAQSVNSSWIAKLRSVALQVGALVVFVAISANENIVKSLSKVRLNGPDQASQFPYSVSSLVCVASILSVLIGMACGAAVSGWRGAAECLDVPAVVQLSPVSILFTAAQVLKFKGLVYMPPDMVVLLDQMSLLMLAFASWLIMGRSYSMVQIMALVMVALSMIQYIGLRDEQKTKDIKESPSELSVNLLIGIAIMTVQCVTSTIACILCERFLKKDDPGGPVPYYVQKARMEVSGAIVSLLYCMVISPLLGGDTTVWTPPFFLFTGWTRMAVVVLFMFLIKVWLSTWISKVLDSVIKQVASCCSLILIYFEMLVIDPANGTYEYSILVSLINVSLAITSFAVSTNYTNKERMKKNRLRELLAEKATPDSHIELGTRRPSRIS